MFKNVTNEEVFATEAVAKAKIEEFKAAGVNCRLTPIFKPVHEVVWKWFIMQEGQGGGNNKILMKNGT